MRIRRLDILLGLIDRFGYSSYLEIGVAGGATFRHIPLRDKVGVDPQWRLWYALDPKVRKVTSDRFFARNRRDFDLVFVDGLHHAEQAYRDIVHALEVLRPGGTVLVHDCMPEDEAQQAVPRRQTSWTGDVWRAFLKVSQDDRLTTLIFDANRGCGLIRRQPRPPAAPRPPAGVDPLDPQLSWAEYEAHRHRWQRIVPESEVWTVLDELAVASAEA